MPVFVEAMMETFVSRLNFLKQCCSLSVELPLYCIYSLYVRVQSKTVTYYVGFVFQSTFTFVYGHLIRRPLTIVSFVVTVPFCQKYFDKVSIKVSHQINCGACSAELNSARPCKARYNEHWHTFKPPLEIFD